MRDVSEPLTMTCRRCGRVLRGDPALELGVRTSRYDRLVFRCDACEVGYSNATSEADRIEITATPAGNVPLEVHAGLTDALGASINVVARPGKAWKFCSANSEDAATWTVIRALAMADQLDRVAVALGVGHLTGGEPARVLLWGAPAPGSNGAAADAAALVEQISRDLGEKDDRRSEPDVVVMWDDLVVVIEAKLGSGNDRQSENLDRFDRYLRRPELWSAAPDEIKAVGFYELVRNWVIAGSWQSAAAQATRSSPTSLPHATGRMSSASESWLRPQRRGASSICVGRQSYPPRCRPGSRSTRPSSACASSDATFGVSQLRSRLRRPTGDVLALVAQSATARSWSPAGHLSI